IVDYAPNALGQPTQAVSQLAAFASGAEYWPDGSLKRYVMFNGIEREVAANARGLPQRVTDEFVAAVFHDLEYAYDPNGNITSISDHGQAGLQTTSMIYDDLDRLTNATALNMWGVASYAYDALDNITQAQVGAKGFAYAYDSTS